MSSKDLSVMIIGAGIAGLAAGVYARLNGFSTQIIEMHNLPGGMVTSWWRNSYLVDGCIEFLNGSNPRSRMHQLWEELGVGAKPQLNGQSKGREFIEHDELLRIRDHNGKELICFADINRFKQHLLELSPADAKTIEEVIAAIRILAAFDPPIDINPLKMIFELPVMMRWLRTFNQYNQLTLEEFAERFRDPFLKKAFPALMPPGMPMGSALGSLAFQANANMGYPLGGSLAFSQEVAQRFTDLGGEIHYQTRAVEILTDPTRNGDHVHGVLLEDGRVFHADIVISAGDGYNAIFNLLHGRYTDDEIRRRYQHLALTPSSVQVSLGVARDFSSEPHSQIDLLKEPLYLAGRSHKYLWYHHFAFDPNLAPQGKTVLISRIRSDYDYWNKLATEPTRYESEKMSVAEVLIQHLETRYPGIFEEIEMVDIATPISFERYTGAHRGVYQSFALTPQTASYAASGMDPELPGLAGFYQIGQWIQPGGGVFPAARSGREIIKQICKRNGRHFRTH